jgi:hypothetical protein
MSDSHRIPVVALVAFEHRGQTFAKGDVLQVRAVEALVLNRARKTRFARADETTVTPSKRRYKRRDLVPEP